jgi:tight adherence protein B
MPDQLTLIAFGVFVLSVAVFVGLGLFVVTVVMSVKRRYRRRLDRVGIAKMSGKMDLEEARARMLRQSSDKGAFDGLSDALGRFIPILDTVRLRSNIRRAGMRMSVGGFILLSLVMAAIVGVVATLASGYPWPLVTVPALLAGMFLVDAFVKFRGNMMSNRFMRQLPEGLDTIIRGIRSGLPVIECIGAVGQEFEAPMGDHFKRVSESVKLGEPLEVGLWRVARVVDRPEMDFLTIAISIQMETGGSLADALGNLANLLRQRRNMKLKIKAISSEAKASALIIGALPFVMLGLLTFMNPDYVMPLFTDPRGHIMLMAGMASITMGAIVMWRMTQFEI